MEIIFYQADAFTSQAFKGNPAGVCLPEHQLPEALMQQIAMENNIAETAFILKRNDGDFDLRWFTPTVEIDLCGHGTLGSAHVLWEAGVLPENKMIRFHTKSGMLTTEKKGSWIEMNFPVLNSEPVELPPAIINALQVNPVNTAFADRYIIEVATEKEVTRAKPDFTILKDFDGIVLTSKASGNSPYDFISRSCVPKHGIDEDPVTGSSHCALLPYWAKKMNKSEFFAYQASARGGEVKLKLSGNRVLISGQAVTVLKGTFSI